MELLKGKVQIYQNVNKYAIDESVLLFEPSKEDIYDKSLNLRYIFHNTIIDTDEEIAIYEFKKYCKRKGLKINKNYFENECLRYLYSAQFEFSKAFELIKSNYEFRSSNNLPIDEKDVIEDLNKGIIYWHGRDKRCRPILVINLLNVEDLSIERLTNLFFFCFEYFLKYLCIAGRVENYVSLIDCTGKSLSKFPMNILMRLMDIMNSTYRCRLYRMYILNAPKLFKTFGKPFLSLAPSYVTKKLKILDKNVSSYLKEEILPTQLEKKYGGIQEILNQQYYPFRFYKDCYIRNEVDKIKLTEGLESMNECVHEYLSVGYSLHLKLTDTKKQHSVHKQKTHHMIEEVEYSNSNRKTSLGNNTVDHHNLSSKKKFPSKRHSSLNKHFVNDMGIKQFTLDENSNLKSNKYFDIRNIYYTNTVSTHKWFFKLRHLFLPEITRSYILKKCPFLKNQITVINDEKSLQTFFEYIESSSISKEWYTTSSNHLRMSEEVNSKKVSMSEKSPQYLQSLKSSKFFDNCLNQTENKDSNGAFGDMEPPNQEEGEKEENEKGEIEKAFSLSTKREENSFEIKEEIGQNSKDVKDGMNVFEDNRGGSFEEKKGQETKKSCSFDRKATLTKRKTGEREEKEEEKEEENLMYMEHKVRNESKIQVTANLFFDDDDDNNNNPLLNKKEVIDTTKDLRKKEKEKEKEKKNRSKHIDALRHSQTNGIIERKETSNVKNSVMDLNKISSRIDVDIVTVKQEEFQKKNIKSHDNFNSIQNMHNSSNNSSNINNGDPNKSIRRIISIKSLEDNPALNKLQRKIRQPSKIKLLKKELDNGSTKEEEMDVEVTKRKTEETIKPVSMHGRIATIYDFKNNDVNNINERQLKRTTPAQTELCTNTTLSNKTFSYNKDIKKQKNKLSTLRFIGMQFFNKNIKR